MITKLILSILMLIQYGFTESDPVLQSDYAFLMDADSGQILYSLNGEERMYPASMTKIMTAIVAIESMNDPEETVLITDEMWAGLIEMNASTAGFWPGSTLTVRDLLYGVLLPSGADAVNALCMHICGSKEAFVERMNAKAAELGMYGTHYTNATGLHDEDHWSTAEDTAVLLTYALQNDLFRQIIDTEEYTASDGTVLHSTINGRAQGIDGFLGGKTGYTIPAGVCLASHAEFNGMHLVLVTAHSPVPAGNLQDAAEIYGLYHGYEKRTLLSEGETLAEIAFLDTYPEQILVITADEDVVLDVPSDAQVDLEAEYNAVTETPVHAGDVLYTCTLRVNGETVYTRTVRSEQEIHRNVLSYLLRNGSSLIRRRPYILLGVLVVLGLLFRRRS
ncbi:MAG: D-alanyl-D-alanine carboxypeptidase [Solobacterium sp.]|nr:D-alanyl-D-alanine carboxypeptidase [Solobacterium sp.]